MTGTARWQDWQDSWDRMQEWYLPDRDERLRVMLDAVEALAGPEPTVLDLACGTGTITDRLLRRLPAARSTGVDLDPALLTIARGHFAGDDRVELVSVDLTDPSWREALPHRSYDAVLTATALHWLSTESLRTLYGQIHGVLRDGGVFMNADHMEDESAPRITAAVEALQVARQEREREAGALDWHGWWAALADDPALADQARRRFETLGDPRTSDGVHRTDRPTTTGWHLDTLRAQGFVEARRLWCSHSCALVVGLR